MKTLFSIVIPVYNAASTLAETLASVQKQLCQDFEIILVDDGSTDDSSAIMEQWLKDNPHIRGWIVTQENKGLGAARNSGIREAGGQWIALLDADDVWLPDKLTQVSQWVVHEEFDMVYHSVRSFGLTRGRVREATSVASLRQLLSEGNPIVPSAVVVRRDIILRHPFSEERRFHGAEDLHLWIKFLQLDYQLRAHHEVLTLYRETEGMSTRLEEHLARTLAVIDHYHEQGFYGKELRKYATHRKYLEVARAYHKRGQHEEAQRYYRQAGQLPLKYRVLTLLNRLKWAL